MSWIIFWTALNPIKNARGCFFSPAEYDKNIHYICSLFQFFLCYFFIHWMFSSSDIHSISFTTLLIPSTNKWRLATLLRDDKYPLFDWLYSNLSSIEFNGIYGLYFYIIRRVECINEHDLVLQRLSFNE